MPIENYSKTPASNNAAPPDGWPEGMAVRDVNDSARQNMADLAAYRDDAEWYICKKDPATDEPLTYTRTGAAQFTISNATTPTDHTARFHAGRRVRVVHGGGTSYATIASSSYSSPTTTVNLTIDGGGSMSGSITQVSHGTLPVTNPGHPLASATVAGAVELATDAETQAQSDTARAITPANLGACTATETRKGIAEIATTVEVQTGTDAERIVTPAGLQACTATETRAGVIEIATAAEVQAATDTTRAVTPATLAVATGVNPFQYVDLVDDFIVVDVSDGDPTHLGSQLGWEITTSGTGSGVIHVAGPTSITNPGVLQLETGTTSSGSAQITTGTSAGIIIGGGQVVCESLIRIEDLATVSNDFTLLVGLFDFGLNDGIYFRYNRASSTNWQIVAIRNGTESSTNTSVVVTEDQWIKLKFVVNASATSVEYFINGTSAGTQTTNLPSGSVDDIVPNISITKTAGTSERVIYIDLFRLQIALTTAR